jgi:hypothetical protein
VAQAVASSTQESFSQALAAAVSSECNACGGAGAASPAPSPAATAPQAQAAGVASPVPRAATRGGSQTLALQGPPPRCVGFTQQDCCSRGPQETACRCIGGWCRMVRVGSSSVWRNAISGQECSC